MLIGDNGQLFGWSEATWGVIDQIGILFGILLPVVTLSVGLLAWFKRDTLRAWLRHNRFPAVGGLVRKDAHWTALIFTVSREEVPQWVMKRARPGWVGLIGTPASAKAVAALEAQAKTLGIRVVDKPRLVDDPDDPLQTLTAARELLATLRTRGITNVAVDVTGGKVPMSLGAFMAAEEARVDSIYVSVDYANGQPQPQTARIRQVSGHSAPTTMSATQVKSADGQAS